MNVGVGNGVGWRTLPQLITSERRFPPQPNDISLPCTSHAIIGSNPQSASDLDQMKTWLTAQAWLTSLFVDSQWQS